MLQVKHIFSYAYTTASTAMAANFGCIRNAGATKTDTNPDYRCAQCMGNARPIDGRPQSEVHVGPDKLEATWVTCFLLIKAVKKTVTTHV